MNQLFKVGFGMPAAKSMAVRIKEIPTVPDYVAIAEEKPKVSKENVSCCWSKNLIIMIISFQFATSYALRKLIKEDIKKENIPMKMFAFGSMLPKEKNLR